MQKIKCKIVSTYANSRSVSGECFESGVDCSVSRAIPLAKGFGVECPSYVGPLVCLLLPMLCGRLRDHLNTATVAFHQEGNRESLHKNKRQLFPSTLRADTPQVPL